MQTIPRLETERLHLRALYPHDADALFEIYSDPQVTKFTELSTLKNRQQAANLISKFTLWFQSDQGIRWGIFLKEDDRLIGICCFDTYLIKYHSANVGYDLATPYWNSGYATEATSVIVSYAFQYGLVSKINRLQAITHGDNVASARVLEKVGFEREGTLREYAFWDGRYHDMHLYSRLNPNRLNTNR